IQNKTKTMTSNLRSKLSQCFKYKALIQKAAAKSRMPLVAIIISIFCFQSPLLFAAPFGNFQQNVVTGRVANSNGEPLVGVSVTVKGSTVGTATDSQGNYSIEVPGNGTLVFSYVGFATKEEPVNGRSSIDVVLDAGVSELDQVIVIGYGTQKKSDLTGSIARV